MMLSEVEIQKAFRLAYFLHPHRPTALRIVRSALFESLPVLYKGQEKRQQQRWSLTKLSQKKSIRPYKLSLQQQGLLQASVFHVSERWERDQEWQIPQIPENIYRPTPDDLLVRYVKLLIARTMDRKSVYLAIGLGCWLYQYSPTQISELAPDLFFEDNIRRVHRFLLNWITERFPGLPIEQGPPYGAKKVRTRRPLPRERALVFNALEMFTPWWTPHVDASESILQLFTVIQNNTENDPYHEGKRIHALIDPACAGLERLINAYNTASSSRCSTMRLDEPSNRLGVPAFQHNEPPISPIDERFNPKPLSDDAILAMREAFMHNKQRRSRYRLNALGS